MFIGEKTIIEEIDPKNIEQMRLWRNDPEMRQYFREYRDITEDMQDKWYKEKGNNSNQSHIYFQIMSKNENVAEEEDKIKTRYLIGCCGLLYIDFRMRSAEFSVYLGRNSRGSGKGSEALKLLFSYGFNELNLHKIWAECFDNNKSINLYRRLGFKDEGILRDNYFHNGKYGNSYRISILENEWVEKYGKESLWKLIEEK